MTGIRCSVGVMVVCAALSALVAQSVAPEPYQWLAVRIEDRRILIEPPIELPWDRLAPRELVDFDIGKPPAELHARLREGRDPMFGHAELTFSIPLPAELEAMAFYLVSDAGIYRPVASNLHGVVRYDVLGTGTISGRSAYGYVEARLAEVRSVPGAGIVLGTGTELGFEIDETPLSPELILPPTVSSRRGALTEAELRFWTIEHQYTFRIGGEGPRYVFVRWAPDEMCFEACCEVRLSVFALTDVATEVASHAASCDI